MAYPPFQRPSRFAASLLFLTLALASSTVQAVSDGPAGDKGTIGTNAGVESAVSKSAPSAGEATPALTLPSMNLFPSPLADKPMMSFETPAPDEAKILMCTGPTPSSVAFVDCCQKGTSTYVGKHEFCYCVPQKFATVCKLGPGSGTFTNVQVGGRCQTHTTHPYWPNKSLSCTQ